MAGKTRVLVVNSQMLQRFASDPAVDRLILIENAPAAGTAAVGGGGVGRIAYSGKPWGVPPSLQARLGDGYALGTAPAPAPAAAAAAGPEGAVRAFFSRPPAPLLTTSPSRRPHRGAPLRRRRRCVLSPVFVGDLFHLRF